MPSCCIAWNALRYKIQMMLSLYMNRKDAWSILVPASELQFDKMKYSILLPILGPCGSGCSVEKEVIDGMIRLCHTGWRGYVTEAVIELPGDTVGSKCIVQHGGNTLAL